MSPHELNQKIHALLDAFEFAGVGTWDWSFATGRVAWNPSMAMLFGTADATLELSEEESFAPILAADMPEMRARVDTAIRDASAFAMDFRVARPDGSIRWLRSRGRAIYDAAGVATNLVGITFDDTRQAGRESRVERDPEQGDAILMRERQARQVAEEVGRTKDEFIATLSHELRTPLNAVLGWAQILLLKTADGSGDVRRGLEAIERNARLQTQLIDDLLDMNRIISGKLSLEVSSIDPVEIIRAAIETLQPMASTKGVQLNTTLAPDIGCISADPSRLQQIIWNLLSNAIKFTPRGGMISVELARSGQNVAINVTDSGIGIMPECIDHLFERTGQADASASRSHNSLGLGLPLVKQLVQLHGGSVAASSPGAGLGTTVSIMLPARAG